MLVRHHLANLKETFFERNLKAHESLLERETLLFSECTRGNHSTALSDKRSGFWDDQYFVTELCQVLRDGSQSSCLTSARTSCQQDSGHIDSIVMD